MATAKAILASTTTTVGQWHPRSHEKTKVGSAAATARQRGGGVDNGDKSESHATKQLRARIGVVSPELYNDRPRGRNKSVWEAIVTGFDGGFVPLGPRGLGIGLHGELSESERAWRADRVSEVLRGLGPHTWESAGFGTGVEAGEESVEEFAQRPFAGLPWCAEHGASDARARWPSAA